MAMNFLGALGGAGLAQPIEAVGRVLDRLFTSDDERLSRDEAMARLAQQPALAQVELNKIEAQHRSVFVAGWRPAIGWIAAISLGCYYIPQGLVGAALWARECIANNVLTPFPGLHIDGLTELVVAMLGLGSLRTLEKVIGRAK